MKWGLRRGTWAEFAPREARLCYWPRSDSQSEKWRWPIAEKAPHPHSVAFASPMVNGWRRHPKPRWWRRHPGARGWECADFLASAVNKLNGRWRHREINRAEETSQESQGWAGYFIIREKRKVCKLSLLLGQHYRKMYSEISHWSKKARVLKKKKKKKKIKKKTIQTNNGWEGDRWVLQKMCC